jgi:hypothetical protein
MGRRAVLACLVLAAILPPARADAPAEDEVPLVGRPADLPFSGASAGFVVEPGPEYRVPFLVSAAASHTRLESQTPLTFTVTITAAGRVRHPPVRIDLKQAPDFKEAFYIEDLTDGQKEHIGPSSWRWVYRLKPRGPGVEEIPGLPFVFYNPDLRPAERAFQVIWTDPIPLTVGAPEPVEVDQDLPDSILEVATGPGVLAERIPWQLPGPVVLTALLSGPPLVCFAWYWLWRRMYPDAARRAHLRRSQAAARALRALSMIAPRTGADRGDQVAAAVAGYLRERFDLIPAEPTPGEATERLLAHGMPADLAEEAGQVLGNCAAYRFPPAPIEEADLVEQAKAFILTLEERA